MKPAKECVTTYLPNGIAPKMDGAEAIYRHPPACVVEKVQVCSRAALWSLSAKR